MTGELVLTAAIEPETGRALLASGRLCANARYNSVGYGEVNLSYWFYGHHAPEGVTGMENLSGVRQMRHAFNSCGVLATLDLSGMGLSLLEDLTYTFSGSSVLTAMWASVDWDLPAGLATFQASRKSSLVGGGGAVWSSSVVAGTYVRIGGGPWHRGI